jgi:putative Mg2+ transporter-C (MgtC) family protein
MDILVDELARGLPDLAATVRIVLRALMAVLLGGVIGYERGRTGKDAGLRTHMLVSLGTALFVMASLESGIGPGDVARVIQGVASGVGFLGAGAILKLSDRQEIRGLTTAAGIWMTAAAGLSAGLGRYGLAVLAVLIGWVILAVVPSSSNDDEPKAKGRVA